MTTVLTDPHAAHALLVEGIDPSADGLLAGAGLDVESEPRALDEDKLLGKLDGIELLGLRSKTQITERVLDGAGNLVAVGAFCIGTNQIDIAAATRRGIAVFNAPFSNTRSVVELTIAEIIALTRGLVGKNAGMHDGVWDKSATGAHEVRGRTLGIVGYGNIGSQLSVLAEAIGMRVLFFDTADRLALGNARRCDTLAELLALSDVISLHVDGRPSNSGLFGDAEFAAMKPGSMFFNLSRGIVVDHGALRAHIVSGHLGGAGIDVFPEEPEGRGDEFVSGLRGLPNVILTPHIGGSTEEAQHDIGRFVAGKLRDYLTEGATPLSVNLPELVLPQQEGTHRIAHLHANVPGVLAGINSILAENKANIEGQLLGTRGEIGYVLTDIASDCTEEILTGLAAMPETIRLRVLS